MREILFKAKRWSDGKWVYGDLNQLQDSTIIHWYNNGCRVADEVDPSTVCEYTGLTDRNGKKIFEGDILSYNCGDGDDEPREVYFLNGRFVVQWAVRGDIDDRPYQTIRMAKVIGNVHDGEGGQHEEIAGGAGNA